MTWPRRPEHGHVGAHLLAVVAVLLALCAPAAAQAPDPAPPAAGPAPDPAPQAADPAQAPPPAAPAPAVEPPAPATPPSAEPVTEPAAAPPATPAAKPRAQRRERAKRRRPSERTTNTRQTPRPRMFGTTAITAPRFVAKPATLASADARLAALALLVAAAGSLGLIGHLRREIGG
jgi:hypothetical protein